MEIRRLGFLPDFQARWKEWKTRSGFLSFPRFPRGVISTALFLSAFSERRDAGRALVAAWASPLLRQPIFRSRPKSDFFHQKLAPGSSRNDDLTAPRPQGPPFLAQTFFPLCSLRIEPPLISKRWALCTKRSRMLSASGGSPIGSCHLSTGSWLVKMVERV